jgi:hypothetical protein
MPGQTKVDHQRVRELAAQGITAKCIAERLGLATGTVHYVLHKAKKEGAK